MDCLNKNKQGADILAEHLAGTLDPVRRAQLDRHTETCANCRDLLAVWDRLDEIPAPAASADFDQRLFARIALEKRLPWWRRMLLPSASWWRMSLVEGLRPSWRPVVPIAAACAVLGLALMVHDPDVSPLGGEPVKQVSVERIDRAEVDQLVQALDDLELLSPVTSDSAGAI